jgi:hypothetical protein
MPIHGVTNAPPRFTRAGHIRLGIKTRNARGSVYPEKSDHFIADFESAESTRLFHEIYGAQPKKITIAFAHETPDEIFPQWYMCYGSSSGLKCKGDGQTALRADATGNLFEVECPTPSECDFAKSNGCKQQARMMFFIRGLPGFQVFQCNTTSWNSIKNINSGLQMLQVVRGDKPIRGVWVDLYLTPQTAQHDGKQVQIYVLKIDIPTNLDNLKALECALEIQPAALPAPDMERDEYLTPTIPAPEPIPAEPPAPPAPAATPSAIERFKAAAISAGLNPRTELEALCVLNRLTLEQWAQLTDGQLTARALRMQPPVSNITPTSEDTGWQAFCSACTAAGKTASDEAIALMQANECMGWEYLAPEVVQARIAELNGGTPAPFTV